MIVLPVTHASPAKLAATIEIPPRVKAHLGLDEQQSWIVLEEANEFIWPGFDLRPVPGAEPTRSDYGVLPPRFFAQVRDAFLTVARERPLKPVGRD